ncbi:MAG: hypothetical protein RJQ01_08125 [Microcella sp.]
MELDYDLWPELAITCDAITESRRKQREENERAIAERSSLLKRSRNKRR